MQHSRGRLCRDYKNKMNNKNKKTLLGIVLAGASFLSNKSYSAELPDVNWQRVTIDQNGVYDESRLMFNDFKSAQDYVVYNTPVLGANPGILFDVKKGNYREENANEGRYIRFSNQWEIPYYLKGESNTDSIISAKVLAGPPSSAYRGYVAFENLNLQGLAYYPENPEYGGVAINFTGNTAGFIKNCLSHIIQVDSSENISLENNKFLIPSDAPINDLKIGICIYDVSNGNGGVKCTFYRNEFSGNGGPGTIAMVLARGVNAGSLEGTTGENVFDVQTAFYVRETSSPAMIDAERNCWIDRTAKDGGRIITDENEILERFVQNYNPTQVSVNVSNPLNYNPLLLNPNDTDRDGLPDNWEMRYFENLDQNANDDFDNDGDNNYSEYVLGTNPTDGFSELPLSIPIQILGGALLISVGGYYLLKDKRGKK